MWFDVSCCTEDSLEVFIADVGCRQRVSRLIGIRKEQSGCVRDLHSCRWWIGFAIGQKMNLNFVPDGHLTRFPLGHCGRLESADSCLSYPFVTARRDKDADTCAQHPPAFYRSLDCIFVVYPQR